MISINWYAVGAIAGFAIYGTLAAIVLRKPIASGLKRIWKMPRSLQAVFLVLVVIATVEAQKQQGGTNGTQNAGGQMMMRFLPQGATVTTEDIERGYRLDYVTNDVARNYSMPTNATYLGNIHIRGASSEFGRNFIDFNEWSFPVGSNDVPVSRWWVALDGSIRPAPHGDENEISTGAGNAYVADGESAIWWAADDEDNRIIEWQNVYLGGDTNTPANLQIVLRPDGGFSTWSNDFGNVYAIIDEKDWDGDGLANGIDPSPLVSDGDAFGTGVEWLNGNCGSVLSAYEDGGSTVVEWLDGVNTNAYYWLTFTTLADGTHVTVTCDGPSNLGNMTVIGKANQVCSIPLLIGATYNIRADHQLDNVYASDEDASIICLRGFAYIVERPVALVMDTDTGTLTSTPNIGASISSVTGGCRCLTFNGTAFGFSSDGYCYCDGGSHEWEVTATWEGYYMPFYWTYECHCHHGSDAPDSTISLSVPKVIMRGGDMGSISVEFDPGEGILANAANLSVSSSGNVAFWTSTNKTQSVSLPVVLQAGESRSLYVEGINESASVNDIVFTLQYGIYSMTRSMTVAYVDKLEVTSDFQGTSANPPPFQGETEYPFSLTNSPSPDKHFVVPFSNVANTDLSVRDFTVDMTLEVGPTGVDESYLSFDWELIEAIPSMSGTLSAQGGATAQFVNPKHGGVYRFRARCNGSEWTEANIVLPLSGATVDSVIEADITTATIVAQYLKSHYSWFERQTPTWGQYWFNWVGMGDYLGRVDNATWKTVWCYNQVNDENGWGAVATLHGVSTRIAKMSNFIVGYTARKSGVLSLLLSLAAGWIGHDDDEAAELSWDAGIDFADDGGSISNVLYNLAHDMWPLAEDKEHKLWPNPQPTDNHIDSIENLNYNYNFISPGCIRAQRNGELDD